MGGMNLEAFKVGISFFNNIMTSATAVNNDPLQFGVYIMFPIGIMYYFGTNLDNRFTVPGFWPSAENSNKIPKSREELEAEYERIVARRRYLQEKKSRENPPQQNDSQS
jgi:protein PET100, fungi type